MQENEMNRPNRKLRFNTNCIEIEQGVEEKIHIEPYMSFYLLLLPSLPTSFSPLAKSEN